jgi:hypothetical protein
MQNIRLNNYIYDNYISVLHYIIEDLLIINSSLIRILDFLHY